LGIALEVPLVFVALLILFGAEAASIQRRGTFLTLAERVVL
jgi:hypothetical protein